VHKLHKAEKLLDILVKRNDDLVPKLYQALAETDQEHVIQILGYKDFHTL